MDTAAVDTAPPAACKVGGDCSGADSECAKRTCVSGSCGFDYTLNGTATAAQVAGDCKKSQCNGVGDVVNVADPADVPNDSKECTQDYCSDKSPVFAPRAAGTPCATGICDGEGNCAECTSAATCSGSDTECRKRACITGKCSMMDVPSGTLTSVQTPGDCRRNECNGSGGAGSVPDDTDVGDDGNDCTNDICSGGTLTHPPKASGTSCATAGGRVCDSKGNCVPCLNPSDCPASPTPCLVPVCTSNRCGTVYPPPGTRCPLPADSGLGYCYMGGCILG